MGLRCVYVLESNQADFCFLEGVNIVDLILNRHLRAGRQAQVGSGRCDTICGRAGP